MVKRFAEIEESTNRVVRVCEGQPKVWYEFRLGGTWVEVLEGCDANKGDMYYPELKNFSRPQPFESWILNTETMTWQAPIPYPNDDGIYTWNEQNQLWE